LKTRLRNYFLPVGVFIVPLTNDAVFPLIPTFMETYGVSVATASYIVPSMMLPFALFMLVSGAISSSLGRKRMLITGFAGIACGSLMIVIADTFTVVLFGRVLQGLSSAFVLPSLIAFIGDYVEEQSRGKVMGAFMFSITLGTALGPAIGGWLGSYGGIKLVFITLCAASLFFTVYYQYFLDKTLPSTAKFAHTVQEIKIAITSIGILGIGFVGGFIFIALIGTMTFSATLLSAEPFNLGEAAVGGLLSLGLGAGMLGAILGGVITDWKGRPAGCFSGLFAMLIGSFIIILTAIWPEMIGIAGFLLGLPLMGLGHAISMTALETLSVEILPEHRDSATSLFNALRFSCYAVAPVLAASFYQIYGQTATYSFLGAFIVIAGIFFFIISLKVPLGINRADSKIHIT